MKPILKYFVLSLLIASNIFVLYSFINIHLFGSITWVEPNNAILYLETFLIVFAFIMSFVYVYGEIIREYKK